MVEARAAIDDAFQKSNAASAKRRAVGNASADDGTRKKRKLPKSSIMVRTFLPYGECDHPML